MLRIALSPTADMHIENLRIALFNYIMSKKLNETLLIRIEDIDKEKNIEGKEKEILEILALFSIEYAQITYQSENLKYHQKMAMQLLTQKKAFSCFCSDEKLKELKEEAKTNEKPYHYDGFCATLSDETVLNTNAPFRVRIQEPKHAIKFNDSLKGAFTYEPFEVDAFTILTHDKTPTYNYASSVDDMLYDITTVITTEDNLSNTPKQIHIRESLGYDKEIAYTHLPLISNKDDIVTVKELIEEGFLPAAIANYLVLLGNITPTEIFTIEEAISWFSVDKLSKNPVEFEINKLRFINQKHLEFIDDMRLSKILGFADEDIGKLGKLYLKECTTIKEIKAKIDAIFSPKESMNDSKEEFAHLKKVLQSAPFFEQFDDLKTYATEQINLKDDSLRYILTGANTGPNLGDIYPLIKNYLGEIIK
ncbi:MAG: glutamate--tRNA ligase [Candidatus Marinarcus sp.]|uniref:glutamate--tRNA ligase n=1 Tax=Candidatus Marinarcus sp. TaxID=3100987 RepID=UPI003B0023D6